MADLAITAANVAGSGDQRQGVAGGSITAGQPVRKSGSQLIAASDASAADAAVVGIALHAASSGQPLVYLASGNIDLGATLAIGKVYVLSTSGGIAPVDDIAGGEFVTVLGVATTASNLKIGFVHSGVAAAGAVA